MKRGWLPALALLAGCGDSADTDLRKAVDASTARVVVAVIDSAVNPYHENYHAGGPLYRDAAPAAVTPEVLAAFGIDADQIVEVTRTGNFRKDIVTDETLWKRVRVGRPYWFKGTNVIGISFNGNPPLKPTPEKNPHGVGTTSSVLFANPEAIVVFVEGPDDQGETFAMTHPAIDIISTSYGAMGSPPVPGHITDSFTGVFALGKLHFGAADNSPASALADTTAGPWWSIGVAGIEEADSNGRQVLSGNQIDFLGDFTQDLPYCVDCERGTQGVGGTSFSTPRSAGTASKVLLELRRAAGHEGGIVPGEGAAPAMVAAGGVTITNWQLRRALEVAAWIPDVAADYTPALDYPIPPGAPWAVAGWGVLTDDPARGVVQEALAQLGMGTPTRTKDPGFCAHQTALIQTRKAYWDWVNTGSETFMSPPSPDPFIFCDLP